MKNDLNEKNLEKAAAQIRSMIKKDPLNRRNIMITNIKQFIAGMMLMALIISVVLNIVLISVHFESVPGDALFGYTKEQRTQMDKLMKDLNK